MKIAIMILALVSLPALAADVCMLKSESTSGMNKTCVYRCVGGEKSITISSVSLCPLTL